MSKIGNLVSNKYSTAVSSDNRLLETDQTNPPTDGDQIIQLYVKPLTLNNDGVTTDMKVNGSVTPQEFYIEAEVDFDIYINSISFFIAAELTLADLGEFAGIPPLTNGCQLVYENNETGTIFVGNDLKTNFDLLRMCTMNPNFGLVSNAAFKVIQSFSNQDDGYLFILKFSDYGYETEYSGGLRLKAKTPDKIIFKIRDNLNLTPSQISSLNGIVYGFKRRI